MVIPSTGPEAWNTSEERHKKFNKFTDKGNTLDRNETIVLDVFANLREQLQECEGICTTVDKLIAHTADPGNRGETKNIEFDELLKAFKIIYNVAKIASEIIGLEVMSPVPVPQFDPVENFNKSLVTDIETAQSVWRQNFDIIEKSVYDFVDANDIKNKCNKEIK